MTKYIPDCVALDSESWCCSDSIHDHGAAAQKDSSIVLEQALKLTQNRTSWKKSRKHERYCRLKDPSTCYCKPEDNACSETTKERSHRTYSDEQQYYCVCNNRGNCLCSDKVYFRLHHSKSQNHQHKNQCQAISEHKQDPAQTQKPTGHQNIAQTTDKWPKFRNCNLRSLQRKSPCQDNRYPSVLQKPTLFEASHTAVAESSHRALALAESSHTAAAESSHKAMSRCCPSYRMLSKCSFDAFTSLLLLLLMTTGLHLSSGIQITRLSVPPHVSVGESAELQCIINLQEDVLYSISWWRDNRTFYQYSLRPHPRKIAYNDSQVTVDLERSGQEVVVLRNVSADLSGLYKCEVVAENTFEKEEWANRMEVIDKPDGAPVLRVSRRELLPGELLRASCTALNARPLPRLSWLVNGKPISSTLSVLVTDGASPPGAASPSYSPTSELQMALSRNHFRQENQLKLTCTASIGTAYEEHSEMVLYKKGSRPVSPMQNFFGNTGSSLSGSVLLLVLALQLLPQLLLRLRNLP